MSILLKNTTYIDWKTLQFINTNIFVEEGKTGKIKLIDNISKVKADKEIDCSNKFVTKSFAIGHHHAYSALSRGMPAPAKTPSNFHEILQNVWWNLDKQLDNELVEASALATAIACAKAGSTFIIDHHSSPNYISGSLQIIDSAFNKVGINHLLCYEISDRNGIENTNEAFEETENYIKNNQALIGLHASFTLSSQSLKKASDLMNKYKTGIHIHVAEDKFDQYDSLKKYNKRVINRLNDYDFLNSSKTILAHCLHINKNERSIINNSNATVVQNTESNLNNKVGNFNSENIGKNIMLGTDGMHSNMIRAAQYAYFTGLSLENIDIENIYLKLRNSHNYIRTNNFIGDNDNNLIVFDYNSPTELNKNNFLAHFLYGFTSENIKHVISNGKLIVENKKILNINEKEVLSFTKQQANRLWKKL